MEDCPVKELAHSVLIFVGFVDEPCRSIDNRPELVPVEGTVDVILSNESHLGIHVIGAHSVVGHCLDTAACVIKAFRLVVESGNSDTLANLSREKNLR